MSHSKKSKSQQSATTQNGTKPETLQASAVSTLQNIPPANSSQSNGAIAHHNSKDPKRDLRAKKTKEHRNHYDLDLPLKSHNKSIFPLTE